MNDLTQSINTLKHFAFSMINHSPPLMDLLDNDDLKLDTSEQCFASFLSNTDSNELLN